MWALQKQTTKWIIYYYKNHCQELAGESSYMITFGDSDIVETNLFKNSHPNFIFIEIIKAN